MSHHLWCVSTTRGVYIYVAFALHCGLQTTHGTEMLTEAKHQRQGSSRPSVTEAVMGRNVGAGFVQPDTVGTARRGLRVPRTL